MITNFYGYLPLNCERSMQIWDIIHRWTKFVWYFNHRKIGIAGFFLKFQLIKSIMDVAARWIFSFGSSLQLFTAHPHFLFAGPTFVWFINIISDKKLCLRFLLDFLINAFYFSSQFGAPAVVREEFPLVIPCTALYTTTIAVFPTLIQYFLAGPLIGLIVVVLTFKLLFICSLVVQF